LARRAAHSEASALPKSLESGKPISPYMRHGDRVRIEMFDASGKSIFGAIDQTVAQYARS